MTDFIDIDPEFRLDPRSNDLQVVTDEESIRKSIIGLVQTAIYSRPFEPEIRSSVSDLEFKPVSVTDPMTSYMYETAIGEVINIYEPRASFINAKVTFPDPNTIKINVNFRVITDPEVTRSLNLRFRP